MITLRRSHERGHAKYSWLDTQYSFSFANYDDPRHRGVSVLRVINDDRIQPGKGFDTHPHQDMEIISYIIEGTIEHQDTLGSKTRLNAGEVQVMSAGTGVLHSEFNPSLSEQLHLLQIWITPDQLGLRPRYQQRDFSATEGIRLLVSGEGRDGSLRIHQDARLFKIQLQRQAITQQTSPGRTYYLHVVAGSLTVNGTRLDAGDGATLSTEPFLNIETLDRVEALLFDLP